MVTATSVMDGAEGTKGRARGLLHPTVDVTDGAAVAATAQWTASTDAGRRPWRMAAVASRPTTESPTATQYETTNPSPP